MRPGVPGDDRREVLALHEFHHEGMDVRGLILFDDAVDLRDVRVVERREHLRLAREPRDALRIMRDDVRQDLDGDITVQLRIARAIHLAHAAFAHLGEDLVGARLELGRVDGVEERTLPDLGAFFEVDALEPAVDARAEFGECSRPFERAAGALARAARSST